MAIHNLLIPKGDIFEPRLTLKYSTSLRFAVSISTVPTSIKISPIGISMAIGDKLYYGGVNGVNELTLTEPLTPLSVVANVKNVPTALPEGTVLYAGPIDLTGWQGFSSIRMGQRSNSGSGDPSNAPLGGTTSNNGAPLGAICGAFPSGISNFNLIPQSPLTTSPRKLTAIQTLVESVQIQSIRPDGSDNLGLIAIGIGTVQEFYINPGSVWSDSASLGQKLDLSQIHIRATVSGDCITLITRG